MPILDVIRKYPREVLLAALIGLVTIPLYGALSDRFGRRPLYLGGALFSLLFAFPFFWMVNTKSAVLIWLAIETHQSDIYADDERERELVGTGAGR